MLKLLFVNHEQMTNLRLVARRQADFDYKANVVTLKWDSTSLLVADIVTIVWKMLFLNKSSVELVVAHHQCSAWANTMIEVELNLNIS